jgi:alpha-tubulin suppressor-like RCC1 family protein
VGHVCPDGQSCDEVGCVPIDVAPEALPGWSGSPPARPDAESCAARVEICNGFDEDCDGEVDEGIDLRTSATHCGRCGSTCAGGTCADGLCADEQVTQLAAGGAHACGVRRDGTITCWGANHERQASEAAQAIVSAPTTRPGVGFVDVTAGVDHTCALTNDGRVACAGNGDAGALGTATGDQSTLGTLVSTTAVVTRVEAGANLTLAIVGGRVVAWGTFGAASFPTPMELAFPGSFLDVAPGARHICALLGTGEVLCQGANDRGQLGQGDTMARDAPVRVVGLDMVTDVVAGRDVTCALRMDGSVWCWGANDAGQLGAAGPDRPTAAPVPMLGAARAVDVARAGAHACAVLEDRTLACWGDNTSGALGDGTTLPRAAVVTVPGVRDVEEVACGGLGVGSGFTCARLASGVVQCWGADALGQTGDGDPGPPTLAPFHTVGRSG